MERIKEITMNELKELTENLENGTILSVEFGENKEEENERENR